MSMRADFYIGKGLKARWQGSIAWNGSPDTLRLHLKEMEIVYPNGVYIRKTKQWDKGKHLFDSKTKKEYLKRLKEFFKYRNDVTLPEQGWPWPWETSNQTDYAYTFYNKKVWVSYKGSVWIDVRHKFTNKEIDEFLSCTEKAMFPNMKNIMNVAVEGMRSGLLIEYPKMSEEEFSKYKQTHEVKDRVFFI